MLKKYLAYNTTLKKKQKKTSMLYYHVDGFFLQ